MPDNEITDDEIGQGCAIGWAVLTVCAWLGLSCAALAAYALVLVRR